MADTVVPIHGNWSLIALVFGAQWTHVNQSQRTPKQPNNPWTQHVLLVKTVINL